jgi:1-deoxy-D-xylulose-5-phosphate reductoisomerase
MISLKVVILGSTGSVGRQALDVVARHPDRLTVVALAAHSNSALLAQQAHDHGVSEVALADTHAAAGLRISHPLLTVGSGSDAIVALAEHPDADLILNALVGSAGLRATIAALRSGKRLALANKESLVVGGSLVTALADPGQLIPVDSEHSAIFQCLEGESSEAISRLWLTASGGPFRGFDRARLATVTAAEALAHPTWTMGPKITIDSATLMNKGLEVIEAHHLFGVSFDAIQPVLQPQSAVHSMVEFQDGSVKAHLGATDMRIPIQYAFSYPERWPGPLEPVDFAALSRIDFAEPDLDTFRCLALAYIAGREGGTMPAVMNAANEIVVDRFLHGACGFLDIERVVASVMEAHRSEPLASVEQVEDADAWARQLAKEILDHA